MKICIIADTHGFHDQVVIPEADVIIHCGDFCNYGHTKEAKKFLAWYDALPHRYKILIAGNHDRCFEDVKKREKLLSVTNKIIYLQDDGVEIDGVKFWGSPWQPEFCNWAFNLPRHGDELFRVWNLIPRNTNILITHGPPYGILDLAQMHLPPYPQNVGCELLRHRLEEIEISYHCYGHLHEGFGVDARTLKTVCINASICNFSYNPINKPIVLDYDSGDIL